MINLLSPADIEINRRHYRGHRLVVAGWLFFSLVVIVIINLWSLSAVLKAEKTALTGRLAKAEQSAAANGISQLEKEVSDLTQKLKILRPGKDEATRISVLLPKILQSKNSQLRLAELNYSQTAAGNITINVRGNAASRKSLLEFIETLRQSGSFSAIDSPVSNLIKEREGPFVIELKTYE